MLVTKLPIYFNCFIWFFLGDDEEDENEVCQKAKKKTKKNEEGYIFLPTKLLWTLYCSLNC